jgi:alpha-L-fucosidase
MNLSLYKPNSKNSGCAFNFSVGQGSKGLPALYASAIQQYSWDEKSKTANFSNNKEDPEKNINVKFNEWEVGAIISCFNNRHEYSTYHTFDENSTTIKFTPWDKSQKCKDGQQTVPAFGLIITRNGNQTFKLPLEPGEVETLKSFLKRYLNDLFSALEVKFKHSSNKKQPEKQEPPDEAPF